MLEASLESLNDPADPLRIEVATAFEAASTSLAQLTQLRDCCKEAFTDTQAFLKTKLKSVELFMLWDEAREKGIGSN